MDSQTSPRISYEEANNYLGHSPESASVHEQPSRYTYFTTEVQSEDHESQFEIDYGDVFENSPFYENEGSIHATLERVNDELIEPDEDVDRDKLQDLKEHLFLLANVKKLITQCIEDNEGDERRMFITTAFAQFQEVVPSDGEEWDDSLEQTVSFLSFYETMVI